MENCIQALAPEAYQLVIQWETLDHEARGELAGQTVGRLGVDFLLPGAAVKLTKEVSAGAKKALEVCQQLQRIEKVAVIEEIVSVTMEAVAAGSESIGLWPSPVGGRQIINNIEYTPPTRLNGWLL